MSTNTTTANSRYDRAEQNVTNTIESFVSTVTDALASSDADEELVEAVESEGEQMAESIGRTVGELRDDQTEIDVEDKSDPLGTLRIDGLPLGRALRSKVTETDVEEIIDEHDARRDESDPSDPQREDGQSRVQTPLERVCGLREASVESNLTRNQQRARFVATGITDYGRKVPAGVAIRSSEIRRVLSASAESSVHTQTVTRVMDYLADLGGDDVSIKTTRSGERTVVFSESIVSRITHVVTDNTDGPVIESTA